MEILDTYITSAPSQQNALDLFKGEWASRLTDNFQELSAGQIKPRRYFSLPETSWLQ